MKISIQRAGGYDPKLGPKHPANQDPTLEAHVASLQTQIQMDVDGEPTGVFRYRWRCSCGDAGKKWYSGGGKAAESARDGGARHVAAMERRRCE